MRGSDLAERLSNYYWLAEAAATKFRFHPDSITHYNAECKAWTERQLLIPPQDDEEKRKAYFAICDEICAMEPTTPGEAIRIYFASCAAVQLIIVQDMLQLNLSDEERGKILGRANDILMGKLRQPNNTSTTSLPVPPNFTEQFRQLNLVSHTNLEPSEGIMDQVIQYRSDTGEVKECRVIDHGMSRLGGDWFLVEDSDDNLEEISGSEMDDILAQRI